MVCRSTPGNSALTSFARLHSGLEDVQVLSLFHEARREAPDTAQTPTTAEYQQFLADAIHRVRADTTLSEARRNSLITRLERAENQRPDAETYYAWRTIEERARRMRSALDTHFQTLATNQRVTVEEVERAFNTLVERNLREGRNAPSAPEHVQFSTANLSTDRATRYALTLLHHGGVASARDDNTGASNRANTLDYARRWSDNAAHRMTEPCQFCGQFQAATGHTCPAHPQILGARRTLARSLGDAYRADIGDRLGTHSERSTYITSDGQVSRSMLAAYQHELALASGSSEAAAGLGDADGPILGMREGRDRLRRDDQGNFVTTDGLVFVGQIDAIRHQRTLAPPVESANRLTLRDARDGLDREPGTGSPITTNGQVHDLGDLVAARFEQNYAEFLANEGAAVPPLLTSPEADGHIVHRDGYWRDRNGTPYRSRNAAVAASARIAAGVSNCPRCGQFQGAEHACPSAFANIDPATVTDTSERTRISAEHRPETPSQTAERDEALTAVRERLVGADDVVTHTGDIASGEQASTDEVLSSIRNMITSTEGQAEEAPARRTRTPLRTYTPDGPVGLAVQMINRSQILHDLRQSDLGDHIDLGNLAVRVPRTPGEGSGPGYLVTGSATAVATSARARRGQDRIVVNTADLGTGTRTLACSCPNYGAPRYECEHTRQVTETVQAILNDRDTVATAPTAAEQEVRSALRSEFQDSLNDQQQARTDFAESSSGASYSDDMAAFQSAWDAAKAHFASGETSLPYMRENATGGLGAREGGRSFGIELEVDFPDDMTYQVKNQVAREIHEAGLSRSPQVHRWHHVGRFGGGYTDAPDNWSVEHDSSVDDVGGRRGCEIVSPILYDEPQTWDNIAKICEIVERHGGKVTPRTGQHINVGAADFDHTVENHNRLLRMSSAYEDVLVRVAHNPQSGATHRGRAYCTASQIPAGGYRAISHAQSNNSHRSMVNLDHVPAEGARVTGSTRVEVRIFDGALDPGRIQTNVKVALGLVNAATRGVEPTTEPEAAGTHRSRNSARTRANGGSRRRLRGDEWAEDTASFRAFADAIFSREEDKAQMVHAFAATRWQAH
jgi:hypothetical protein